MFVVIKYKCIKKFHYFLMHLQESAEFLRLYQKAPCNSGSLSTFKIRVVAIKKKKNHLIKASNCLCNSGPRRFFAMILPSGPSNRF